MNTQTHQCQVLKKVKEYFNTGKNFWHSWASSQNLQKFVSFHEIYGLPPDFTSKFNPLSASVVSYRNQSTDLHSKSTDWFVYEGNTGI